MSGANAISGICLFGALSPAGTGQRDLHNCLAVVAVALATINVDKARIVFVLKRSMAAGFAGIENPLFYKDNTRMMFGDPKESIGGLVREFNWGSNTTLGRRLCAGVFLVPSLRTAPSRRPAHP
jgi:NAD(P) transhydrogenase beta subunit/4TM region of pyridine nucleotide transhydrogenase, mitoch